MIFAGTCESKIKMVFILITSIWFLIVNTGLSNYITRKGLLIKTNFQEFSHSDTHAYFNKVLVCDNVLVFESETI